MNTRHYEYDWLRSVTGASEALTINDMWCEKLVDLPGTLKDKQMAYWKELGCTHFDDDPYWTYDRMSEWFWEKMDNEY